MQSLHQSQSIPIMGIREIFFPAPRAVTLPPAECLGITLRHENDYFIGKSEEDLVEMKRTKNLPEWVLPRFPLTARHVKEHLKNDEVLRNKKNWPGYIAVPRGFQLNSDSALQQGQSSPSQTQRQKPAPFTGTTTLPTTSPAQRATLPRMEEPTWSPRREGKEKQSVSIEEDDARSGVRKRRTNPTKGMW